MRFLKSLNKLHLYYYLSTLFLVETCIFLYFKVKDINGENMGIHYDYKSTRGEKAMKKEAKRKARLEERRAKKLSRSKDQAEESKMHDIQKPITLEDLTNPNKN